MSRRKSPTPSGGVRILAADGGGTKTEAVVVDSSGAVLARSLGGPSNHNYVSKETVQQSIRDALTGVVGQLGIGLSDITLVGMCFVGGLDTPDELLAELGYRGETLRFGEGQVALARAGISDERGVAVVAGTGSSFWANDGKGKSRIIGGWGPVAGEEGSAFDIGLRGIRAAGRAADGRGPQTILLQRALEHFGTKSFGEILARYCRPKIDQPAIAGFAKAVTHAAVDGDAAATGIVVEAARSLASDICFAAQELFAEKEAFPIALAGGVFNAGDILIRPLSEIVKARFPNAAILPARLSPAEAVAHLTLKRLESRDREVKVGK